MNLQGSGPGLLQLDDPGRDRVGCRARPRQHPQRVPRWQPAAQHRGRPGCPRRPGRRRRRRHRRRLQRRRRAVQQHRLAGDHPRRHRRRRHDDVPGLPPDDPLRHAAEPGRLGEQQHHGAQLRRRHRSSTRPRSTSWRRATAAGRCAAATPTRFIGCADIDHGANPPPIWAAGGTSASAPETSGTAALVISAYETTHHGKAPSPGLVQQIIVSSAQDLGAPADRQGAGLVDTLKAVQLAESINGGTSRQGNSLFVRQSSLSATTTRATARSSTSTSPTRARARRR